MPVEDPSAYGLVRLDEDRSVSEFVEKPSPDAIDTNLISAGAYVLEKEVVDLIEPDRNVSIEREIWPQLVGDGLYAYPHDAYWLDIGTPERYLAGDVRHPRGPVQDAGDRAARRHVHRARARRARIDGRVVPPAVIGRGDDDRRRARTSARSSSSATA